MAFEALGEGLNVKGGALNGARERQDDAQERERASHAGSAAGAKSRELPRVLSRRALRRWSNICPPGDDWLHEVKYDGYRMVCRVDRGKVRIYSRNGKDWTVGAGVASRRCARSGCRVKSAWLDGEVVVMRPDGRTSFQAAAECAGRFIHRGAHLLRLRCSLTSTATTCAV